MPVIVLHDLDNEEVLINTDHLTAVVYKVPAEDAVMRESFSKLFFTHPDKSMDARSFPDKVKETPTEIYALSRA